MAIVQTIDNFSQFYAAIPDNRLSQFSCGAWEAIFDYLNDLSDETGEDIELDCVGICCGWSEYNSIDDFLRDYSHDFEFSDADADEEEKLSEIEDYLNQNTMVIGVEPDCILFQSF